MKKTLPATIASYDAARRALDKAVEISEAKPILDFSIGMQEYAKRAKDPHLMSRATELRLDAEKKLGEIHAKQKAGGFLATGSRGTIRGRDPSGGVLKTPLDKLPAPTLDEVGIDKNLAKRIRKVEKMSPEQFKAHKAERVALAVAGAEGDKEIVKAAKARRHAEARARRKQREAEFAGKVLALPDIKAGVIYVDPEWKFVTYSEAGKDATSAENHYPTSSLDEIKARPVASIAAKDCVLFMWATAPLLPEAIEVLKAWGFRYVSRVVWGKTVAGTGYWFRDKAEELLVGVRGNVPAPAQGDQWESLQISPKGRHSEKPDWAYELIEAYFPNVPKIELNARRARKGWQRWGFEAPEAEAAE